MFAEQWDRQMDKCPFCGGDVELIHVKTNISGMEMEISYYKCKKCGEEMRKDGYTK